MSDSRTAGGLDRLPWLTDEPATKRAVPVKRGARDVLGWAGAAVLLVAGVSFWLGTRSQEPEMANPVTAPASTTVAVPQPHPGPAPEVRIAPQPQVAPAPAPEVRPTPAPEVRIAPPRTRRVANRDVEKPAPAAPQVEKISQVETVAKTEAPAASTKANVPAKLTPWPPRVTAGAYGRLVQIGAFGSVQQAKDGWRYMVRAYPALAHLPAVVRPDRNSKGRVFYRFRIGTTSQAHSEVLCQRMQKIAFSCAVVGLPWKAKIER